jgi:hypothetical protein
MLTALYREVLESKTNEPRKIFKLTWQTIERITFF